MKRWRPHLHFCAKDLKGYVGFGMYQMGERTLNYLGRNMDKLLIGSLMGAQTLGYYQVAYQLMIKPFQVFNPIITRVSFPVLAKIQDDSRRLCRGYLDIIRVIALVLFPVYMGMIVLAKPFIILLLGQEWLGSVSVFRILAILGFFYSLGNPIGSLLLAKGRADIGFYLNLLVIFVYSIAILIGVRISVDGVAAALVIATALVLFPLGFWVRWFLVRMRPAEYIMAFMPMLASSLTMGLLLYFLNVTGHFSDKNIFHLLLFIVAGASVYLPIVLLWQKPILGRLWKTSRTFE
jgi:lipopolysaccharide exporter